MWARRLTTRDKREEHVVLKKLYFEKLYILKDKHFRNCGQISRHVKFLEPVKKFRDFF